MFTTSLNADLRKVVKIRFKGKMSKIVLCAMKRAEPLKKKVLDIFSEKKSANIEPFKFFSYIQIHLFSIHMYDFSLAKTYYV